MNLESLKKLLKYLKPYSAIQMAIVVLTLGGGFLEVVDPLIYKMFINEVFVAKNIMSFWTVVILYFTKTCFSQIFYFSREYLAIYLGQFISMDIRKKVFKTIVGAKLNKKFERGKILTTFNGDISMVEKMIGERVFILLFSIFKILGIASFTLILSWQYFLCFLIVIPLRFLNNAFWMGPNMKNYNKMRESNSNVFSFFYEGLKNTRYIKITGKEKYIERKFFGKNKDLLKNSIEFLLVYFKIVFIDSALQYLDKVIMIGVGGYLFYMDQISIGTYLALITYELTFKQALEELVISIPSYLTPLLMSLERIENLYKIEQEHLEGKKIDKLKGEIEIKDIDYRYDGEEFDIFNDFNMKIKSGEKLAIVGESGSGKSTLINLILGLIKPTKGKILVDGVDIDQLSLKSYRKNIGLVAQENFFFNDTVQENLTLGDKIDKKDIKNFLKISKAENILSSNRNGLNNVIESGGNNFSGGEKQRLAIARMLLRKPDVVILDEASSALDNITEEELQRSLEKELKEKTVITIAHRLSTIKNSDRIVLLKKGEIAEEGSHDYLMSLRGEYYNLVKRKEQKEN